MKKIEIIRNSFNVWVQNITPFDVLMIMLTPLILMFTYFVLRYLFLLFMRVFFGLERCKYIKGWKQI